MSGWDKNPEGHHTPSKHRWIARSKMTLADAAFFGPKLFSDPDEEPWIDEPIAIAPISETKQLSIKLFEEAKATSDASSRGAIQPGPEVAPFF